MGVLNRMSKVVAFAACVLCLVVATPARSEWNGLVGSEAPALEITSWAAAPEGATLDDLRGSVVVLLLGSAADLADAKTVTRWNDLRAGWWEKGLRVVALVGKDPGELPAAVEYSVAVGKAPAYGAGTDGRAVLVGPDGKIVWEGEPDALGDDLIAKALRKARSLHLGVKGPAAKLPAAAAFKKGKLAAARTLAGDEPVVAARVTSLLTYWQAQAKRATAAENFDEASTCLKRITKHLDEAPEAIEAAGALKALKGNNLVSKECSAADAYARLRQDLARAGGKEKKLAALAKKAERVAKKKPLTKSVARADRLAAQLRADPATAALEAFIAKEKIKTKSSSWRNNLPKPPLVEFAKGKTYLWTLKTNKGSMTLKLFADSAPMHVGNLMYLTMLGFYDGLTFHRVIPGFMAQGGCPDGSGSGRIGYGFDGEFDGGASHDKGGKLSAANAGPGTDGSQFFITFVETKRLDGKHTVYGEVISGEGVLKKLEKEGTPEGSTQSPLTIEKATLTVK